MLQRRAYWVISAMLRYSVKLQYTLENALHVFWLPRRIRYTSSDYFGVRVVRLSVCVSPIKASDIVVVVSDIVIGTLPCV